MNLIDMLNVKTAKDLSLDMKISNTLDMNR